MIRPSVPSDRTQLKQLWCRVFGDPPELVDRFLELLPEMGVGCVAEQDGELLGAAYLIHGFSLLTPGADTIPCGYLYAVAVSESARGHGLGAAVSRGAAELGRQSGSRLLCTLPAEESLYRWYEDILSLRCQSTRTVFTCDRLPAANRLTTAEYLQHREQLLQNCTHVRPNPAAMAFQEALCASYDGGLYETEDYLFCAYLDNGRWYVPELIPADPAVRLPSLFLPQSRPYVCSDLPFPEEFIWNLTFD